MERGDLEREQDIEELRTIALAQHAQIQALLEIVATKSREVERLRGSAGDLQLTLKMLAELQAKAKATAEKIEKAKPKETAARKARSTTGPTPQPLLPIVEREFTLDDADRACPSCGGNLQPMKDQFDESEMIDVVEVRYELVKVKQQKYVCRCGGCVETALGPARALSGSRYSLAFAVKIIIDKWLDHIPLERQVRILERHGLSVSSSTLWDLAYAVTQELSPLSAALLDHVKRQPVIGLDQTSWPRLESDATKPWQMWCLTAPGVVVHRIRDDKSADTFADLVGDYVGTIVADA
ncbi:MAG: transposase, partial [Deltaproteobacteria bacterium]|nr:transposase [Deltaproteobacteria bacterium]